MGLKEWGTGMVIFTFVGVQTAHAAHSLDSIKQDHTHIEGYELVGTTDNISMAQTTGGGGIVGSGALKAGESVVTGQGTVR